MDIANVQLGRLHVKESRKTLGKNKDIIAFDYCGSTKKRKQTHVQKLAYRVHEVHKKPT
jgi:hypothetical protein